MIYRFTSVKKGLAAAAVLAGVLGLVGCGSSTRSGNCSGRVVSASTGNCAALPVNVSYAAPAATYAAPVYSAPVYSAPVYSAPAPAPAPVPVSLAMANSLYYDGPVSYPAPGVTYPAPPINYAPPSGMVAQGMVVHSGNPLSHMAQNAGGGAVPANYPLVSYDGYKGGAYASAADYIPTGPNDYVVPGSLRTIKVSNPVATTQAGGLPALAAAPAAPARAVRKAPAVVPAGRRGPGAPRFSDPIPSAAVAAVVAQPAPQPAMQPAPAGPLAVRTTAVVPVPASTPIMEPPMDTGAPAPSYQAPAPVPAVVSESIPPSGVVPPLASLEPEPALGGGDLYVTPGETQVNTYVPGPDPAGYYGGGIEPLGLSGILASDPAVHYTTRATCNVIPANDEAVVWSSGF